MRKHPQIVIGVLLIALFICIAITAPLLAPNDPNATNLALKNAPPSAEYPLGCDQMGRCELSRLIYGARYSLSLTVPVLIVLAAIALFIGCYTSYKGGLIDEVIRLLCDIFMAFPLLVIAMSLLCYVGLPGVPHFVPFRCSAAEKRKKRALQHSRTAACKAPNTVDPAADAGGWCA